MSSTNSMKPLTDIWSNIRFIYTFCCEIFRYINCLLFDYSVCWRWVNPIYFRQPRVLLATSNQFIRMSTKSIVSMCALNIDMRLLWPKISTCFSVLCIIPVHIFFVSSCSAQFQIKREEKKFPKNWEKRCSTNEFRKNRSIKKPFNSIPHCIENQDLSMLFPKIESRSKWIGRTFFDCISNIFDQIKWERKKEFNYS